LSSKFVIDGKIEGRPESAYLKEKSTLQKRKLQRWILVMGVLAFVFLLTSLFLLIELKSESSIKNNDENAAIQVENQKLNQLNDTLQKQVIHLTMRNKILEEQSQTTDGVFFEVQIGNFSELHLDATPEEMVTLHQDKLKNSSKLCLGRFRSFQKAMLFENEVRRIGFTGAFVVGRIDGKLVDYQEALKVIRESGGEKTE
jgi:hypothetical protein